MRLCIKVLSALLLVALLVPPVAAAVNQIAAPLERNVSPGVTTITYSNQTLVFTTAVPLRIKLRVTSPGHIELQFKAQETRKTGRGQTSAPGQTIVFWDQAGDDIFNDAAGGSWVTIPLTEGGWTEK